MTLKRILSFITMVILLNSSLISQENTIEVQIKYYNKHVYFTNSKIYIKILLINSGTEPYSFKLSENKIFNIDFEGLSSSNLPLKHSKDYTIQKNSNQHVFYREIDILPGEEYSFVEDLTAYLEITESGAYYITGKFFPSLNNFSNSENMSSNTLTLEIRPGKEEDASSIGEAIDYETKEILRQDKLPPDEVVSYTINARQKSQWDKFFLYMDVESLYTRDPARKKAYNNNKSESERRVLLAKFKEDLKKDVVDKTIIVIPSDFEIKNTQYTQNNAEVKAHLYFNYTDFTEIKEYIYYLTKKDDIWYITNYEVKNIGTR